MESQSHSFVAGLFVLVLGIAVAAGGFWLAPRKNADQYAIDLLTTHSVSGLLADAPVRFRGVDVGRVRSIAFDAAESGRVRVRIEVERSAPLTTATYAKLGYEGINGVALIQLDDDPHKLKAPLLTSGGDVPRMELEPGILERAEVDVGNLLSSTQRVAARLQEFLSEKNEARIFGLVDSLERTSERYGQLAQNMEPSIKALPGLVHDARLTIDHARATLDNVTVLTGDADRHLADLDAVAGAARQIGQTAEALRVDTLPRLNALGDEFSTDARELRQALHQANTRPESFIFGPELPAPGPGEHGFASIHGAVK